MNPLTRLVRVVFGPGQRTGSLAAPGEADCRWRAVTLDRLDHAQRTAGATNDEAPGAMLEAGASTGPRE